MIAPKEDNLCPYNQVKELARLSSQVEVYELPCGESRMLECYVTQIFSSNPQMLCRLGHFELYPGMSHYEEALAAMKEFLLKRVPPV